MGFDEWGPTRKPTPPVPTTVVGQVSGVDQRQRRDDRSLSKTQTARSADGKTLSFTQLVPTTTDGVPVSGDPVVFPPGVWLLTIFAMGEWEQISVGIVEFPSLDLVVSRTGTDSAGGSLFFEPIADGTYTPQAMGGGSGGGGIAVSLKIERREDLW